MEAKKSKNISAIWFRNTTSALYLKKLKSTKISLYIHVCNWTIPNIQAIESTWMSIHKWMNEKTVVYTQFYSALKENKILYTADVWITG